MKTSLAFLFVFTTIESLATENAIPKLSLERENFSDDGHITIQWEMPAADAIVEVQQAEKSDFSDAEIIYSGPDNATFISGLANGVYFYRIRKLNGEWSEPVAVTVQHHSLSLAFTLFGLGAVVFLLTVIIVVKGAMNASLD